jgi:hypothetical protein
LRAALQPVPPPAEVRAILDSGAEVTCIDGSVVQTLGFPVGGITLANVPAAGGLTIGLHHDVNVTLVHPSGDPRQDLVVEDWPVIELRLRPLGYQVLVGRDVLNRCRFVYHGPRGRFRLAY